MPQPIVGRRVVGLLSLLALCAALVGGSAGCLTVREPLLRVESPNAQPAPIDTSRVPPLSSVEEGRQRLAEAYARIDSLERQLNSARGDNAKLKADLKNAKRERDAYKDQLKKLRGD